MRTILLPIICLMLFLSATVSGECHCGRSPGGICSCQEAVARPKFGSGSRLIQPEISKVFPPIGDSCSCGNAVVQPAIPPKPACQASSLRPVVRENCQEFQVRAPDTFQGPNVDPSVVYGNKKEVRPLPADAVSLSLAYQLARSLHRPVPEDKVQFGFQVQPLNGAKKGHSVNIPEEKLWTMNREVIELKATNIAVDSHEDDDIEDEASKHNVREPGYLSYGDIGYCPEKPARKTFSIRLPSIPLQKPCSNIAPVSHGTPCGYSPGKIYRGSHLENHSTDRGIEDCDEAH